MHKNNITVIIVTYNRLELLKKCLKSVFRQTLKPDNIIVVNNGSTDGTYEYLSSLENVKVINQDNTGSAGGFNTGVNEALKTTSNWFVLLDDDCECSYDYFEKISYTAIRVFEKNNKEAIFSGLIEEPYFINGRIFYGVKNGMYLSEPSAQIYETVDLGFPFMFLHRTAVETAGLPYKFWFTINDDTEWIWRMRNKGFKCYMVNIKAGVHYNKREIKNGRLMESPFRIYYLVRNSMLYYYCTGRGFIKCAGRGLLNIIKYKYDLIPAVNGFFSGFIGVLNFKNLIKKESEY